MHVSVCVIHMQYICIYMSVYKYVHVHVYMYTYNTHYICPLCYLVMPQILVSSLTLLFLTRDCFLVNQVDCTFKNPKLDNYSSTHHHLGTSLIMSCQDNCKSLITSLPILALVPFKVVSTQQF